VPSWELSHAKWNGKENKIKKVKILHSIDKSNNLNSGLKVQPHVSSRKDVGNRKNYKFYVEKWNNP
jgi:hypothetical protein